MTGKCCSCINYNSCLGLKVLESASELDKSLSSRTLPAAVLECFVVSVMIGPVSNGLLSMAGAAEQVGVQSKPVPRDGVSAAQL